MATILNSTAVLAFPDVGSTYQIDRARYNNQKIAICTSEELMDKWIEAQDRNDKATMKQLLKEEKNYEQIEQLEKTGGCTLISSYSQATVKKKGISSHQAEFATFPFMKMWGYYLYFGGKVR